MQFTAATVATSAPGEYSPDTPMNSMGGISSHLDSQSPQPPMPSSYHAAPRPSDASDNRRTHTTGGHPSYRNPQAALSSYGGGMLHPPTTQAPPPTPQTSTGYHGHAYHTQDTDTAHHPHPSTNSATAFPPHPTGAYHSSPAAQHSQTQPAGLSQRSSQDSTTTNSTDHWSTTANVGSRR
ncbi:hypothetical protein CPB85DRAFT_486927 [Mucidula mucida]|nr:hypothetical protein CPB85DRAFT_486927 [Mucidula mucida]